MDWLVREAGKRGLYVIFDLHVWPEQQVQYDRIGRPEGAAVLAAMADFWAQVALHYKGEGVIAAFDLINEFPGAWGVQQPLASAIHRVDPGRLLVVEGFAFQDFINLQREGVFANSIYSDHVYRDDPIAIGDLAAYLKRYVDTPVPVFIGELQPEDFAAATAAMSEIGVSWATWKYKTVDMGEWGIFNYTPELETDIQVDTYESILDNWSRGLTQWLRSTEPNHFVNEHRHPAADAQGAR